MNRLGDIQLGKEQLFELITRTGRVLVIPRIYIEIVGNDTIAGLVLSQLIYWAKTREWEWFSMSYAQWNEATALSSHRVRRAIQDLEKREYIETKVSRKDGLTYKHYRVIRERIIDEMLLRVGSLPTLPEVKKARSGNQKNAIHMEVKKASPLNNSEIEINSSKDRGRNLYGYEIKKGEDAYHYAFKVALMMQQSRADFGRFRHYCQECGIEQDTAFEIWRGVRV